MDEQLMFDLVILGVVYLLTEVHHDENAARGLMLSYSRMKEAINRDREVQP